MDEVYVVDAVNFLFRSYYAIEPMTNEEGKSTSALFGFIRSLQKLIKEFSPSHLVAVFDGPENTQARTKIYADYKAHRKKAPEDLYVQISWAYQFCELAGIPALSIDGVEADDTMASIALWAQKEKAKTFLCTSDKDLCQLVSTDIFVLNTHKNNLLYDTEKVREVFGVYPNQILDLLSLMGDTSDNIPGLPGFGPKISAELLNQYGSLDQLLEKAQEVKGKKGEILRTEKEKALLSRRLATLDTHVPIPKEPVFYQKKEPNWAQLEKFYRDMGFYSLLKEISSSAEEKTTYLLVDTQEQLKELVKVLEKQSEIALDTETTSLKPLEAELVGIGFCAKPKTAAYVPLNGKLSKEEVLTTLAPLFENTAITFIGHNLKYDLQILQNEKIRVKGPLFDTLLASYVLAPQNRRHNLDLLSLEHFGKTKISLSSLIGQGKKQITMKEVPLEKACEYCCEDVDYTFRLKQLFAPQIEEKRLSEVFYCIEMPLLPVLLQMESNGVFLNQEKLKSMETALETRIHQIEQKIYEETGEEFNLNSPKQLSEVLFQKLGLKEPTRKKTVYSTGAKVLEMLAEENSVASKILEYRGLEKLRSTYVNALPKQINPHTHRIHPNFNQSVTATGRLSCQDPNLQNIPIRTEEGRKIREGFEPQKQGWIYLSADYSQIELRLLAHFSGEEALIEAFTKEEDIHKRTASTLYQVPLEQVTKEMRYRAKTVNFGIIYGQSAFGLSEELKIPVAEASQFIKKYFTTYPKVALYLEACKEKVQQTGICYTLTGRQRPIPEIHSKNPHIRAAAERLAVNTPLQGTNADIIKLAMIAIQKEISQKNLQGFMVLQIHDELVFEIPEEEKKLFYSLVKEKMETVFPLKVPLTVQVSVGKNWGEC